MCEERTQENSHQDILYSSSRMQKSDNYKFKQLLLVLNLVMIKEYFFRFKFGNRRNIEWGVEHPSCMIWSMILSIFNYPKIKNWMVEKVKINAFLTSNEFLWKWRLGFQTFFGQVSSFIWSLVLPCRALGVTDLANVDYESGHDILINFSWKEVWGSFDRH